MLRHAFSRQRSVCILLLLLIGLNTAAGYDKLSFFEKPVAITAGPGKISAQTLIEWERRSENNNQIQFSNSALAGDFRYLQQLANDWDISIRYYADYLEDRPDQFIDELQLSVEDSWGRMTGGEVSTVVLDAASRQDSAGLLGLDNTSFLLPLEQYGLNYRWRTPGLELQATIDENANLEGAFIIGHVGGRFQSRLSLRANYVEDTEGNAQGIRQASGIALFGEVQRGRWLFDAQWLSQSADSLESGRQFDLTAVSSGLHYRFNRVRWSLTASNEEDVLDNTERNVAIGMTMALARGLFLNLGANQSSSKRIAEKFNTYATSIRYEF